MTKTRSDEVERDALDAVRITCRPGDPTADLPFEMPRFSVSGAGEYGFDLRGSFRTRNWPCIASARGGALMS